MQRSFCLAVRDLISSVRAWRLWSLLGWLEIRQRYARSKLGPFWITISMGVFVGTLATVYGALFGQRLSDYLPTIACGVVMWGLFSSIVSEGASSYTNSAHYMRQINTPRLIYVLQVAWRNLVIFAHNFIIVAGVLLIFGVKNWLALLLFLPGLTIYLLNAMWIAALIGLLAARFRDLPQIVAALLQIGFYITPILFSGRMLTAQHRWIVDWNPLAYLIDIVREPLLGNCPPASAWGVSLAMLLLGWTLALAVTGRYYKRIPFWV